MAVDALFKEDPEAAPLSYDDQMREIENLCNEAIDAAEKSYYRDAQQKFEDALRIVHEMLPESNDQELIKKKVKILEMKAQVLLEVDKPFQAIKLLEEAIENQSDWWILYQTLGRAQLQLGEPKLALGNFKKCVSLDGELAGEVEDDIRTAKMQIAAAKQNPYPAFRLVFEQQ